jgi:uncharacterized membrane protein YeaQ/YmgE (transglycosylase-associated protein family)
MRPTVKYPGRVMCDTVKTAPVFMTMLIARFPYGMRVKAYGALPRRAESMQALKTLQIQEANMSILAWIVLGLVAGFIASKLVGGSGQGVVMDIILGIVGAVVGGWLFNTFGMAGVAGFNLYSLLVAVVGAALLLVVYHAVSRGVR